VARDLVSPRGRSQVDMRTLRDVLAVGLLVFGTGSAALAVPTPRRISASGASLLVPAGWHALVSTTPNCDPERLIVASSAPLRSTPGGTIAAPGRGQVVVLLLEDRLRVDRPSGDLRRPAHFSVAWSRLTPTKPARFCGNPDARASLHFFRSHGRFLGFIVYPGTQIGPQARANTLALMDSLRVAR
jgi:hypothetical protein